MRVSELSVVMFGALFNSVPSAVSAACYDWALIMRRVNSMSMDIYKDGRA